MTSMTAISESITQSRDSMLKTYKTKLRNVSLPRRRPEPSADARCGSSPHQPSRDGVRVLVRGHVRPLASPSHTRRTLFALSCPWSVCSPTEPASLTGWLKATGMFPPVPRTTFDLRRPPRCLAHGTPCVTVSGASGPAAVSQPWLPPCDVLVTLPSVPARPLPTPSRRGPWSPPMARRTPGFPGSRPLPGRRSATGGGGSARSGQPAGGRFRFPSGARTCRLWRY